MEIQYLATGQNDKIFVTQFCDKTQARIGLKKSVTKFLWRYFDKKNPAEKYSIAFWIFKGVMVLDLGYRVYARS